jgi:hypothetical protein
VLFMIVYYILRFLQPLIQRLFALLQQAQLFQPLEQPEATPPPALPEMAAATLPDAYRWLALAFLLLAVAAIFALVLRKLRAAPAEFLDEERESIFSTDLLQDQLSKLWQKWFGRPAAEGGFLSLEGEPESRRRIRQAYQELLAAATTLGQPRQQGQTPSEFRQQLAGPLANAGESLATMTEQYNLARYAPEPPSNEDATTVQQAWGAVQREVAGQEQPPAAAGA